MSSPSSQSDLREPLSKEIHGHAWEFDAERIAKMFSATDKGPPDTLVSTAHEALERRVSPVWPTVNTRLKRTWYTPLAVFLNNCVDACRGALDEHHESAKRSSRFYDRLRFIVYDKPTHNGVEDASPIKPDLMGGLDLTSDERIAWSPQNSLVDRVLIPVEVNVNWSSMVTRATAYTHHLFSANPSQQFSVVLGFQHAETQLRFLVFHPSGLTGSKPCSVRDPQGQKDILRILLSILEWSSHNDAGFLEIFDDFEMSLLRHEGDETGTVARVTEALQDGLGVRGRGSRALLMDYSTSEGKEPETCYSTLIPNVQTCGSPEGGAQTEQGNDEARPHITPTTCQSRIPVKPPSPSKLVWSSPPDTNTVNSDCASVVVKHSWCEDGRQEVEGDFLVKSKDGFGGPRHHYSFYPADSCGRLVSAARFLPIYGEKLEDFHWAIAYNSEVSSHLHCRDLWMHVNKSAGWSLVHVKTPWDLFVAIGHGVLGWLLMVRMGFLHRDINIGNVLMLDPPMTKPFEAWTMEQLVIQLRFQDEGEPLVKYVSLLEQIIMGLGSPGKCHDFVIDGDMAARFEDSLTFGDLRERSETYEFMSKDLVDALWSSQSYLHSPVDDLESFYYTAQWAAAFNDGASRGKHDGGGIQEFQEKISGDKRLSAIDDVRSRYPGFLERREQEYGTLFVNSAALLRPWLGKLDILKADWPRLMDQAKGLEDTKMKEHLTDNFLVYGYRGVAEYFEFIHEHRASLEKVV